MAGAGSFRPYLLGARELGDRPRPVRLEAALEGGAVPDDRRDLLGTTLTFAAPTGQTLPVIATGTLVEVRGVTINGVLTLTRLRA